MDATSGLNMAVVGVTTVFLALTMLVAVVAGLARLLDRPAPAVAPSAAADAASVEAPAADETRRRAVALAAFAFHHHVTRRRRFAALVTAQAGAPWLQAARAEQASALPTRG